MSIGAPDGQHKATLKFDTITEEALGLHRRVPEFLRLRGHPATDTLSSVLGFALAVVRIADQVEQRFTKPGARRMRLDLQVMLRRPAEADGCGDRWPATEERLSAASLVERFDLLPLLESVPLVLDAP